MKDKDVQRLKEALEKLAKESFPELRLGVADWEFVLSPSELLACSTYITMYLMDKT